MNISGLRIRSSEGYMLLAMLIIDLAFLALTLAQSSFEGLADSAFSLLSHQGIAEHWQYLKQLVCAGLLLHAGIRCRLRLLVAWAALFFYLFATDAFLINDLVAGYLMARVQLPSGLPGYHWQQWTVITTVVAGLVLAGSIAHAHLSAAGRNLRLDSLSIAALLGVFLFFGILVDRIHKFVVLPAGLGADPVSMVEEWGQMLSLSVIVLVVYLTAIRTLREYPHLQLSGPVPGR